MSATSNSTIQSMTSARGKSRGAGRVLLEFLGSMNLAITLLAAIAIASIIGTVLQQNQAYNDYLIEFGPFWFEVFERLGLYRVYSAAWFLFVLAFLVISTGVCVYRNGPAMLRDMRAFRLDVRAKSLRAFKHRRIWQSTAAPTTIEQQARDFLIANGYRVRTKQHRDHRVLAARKGGANRLGYLFTHLAIVIICFGGLIDGRLPIKFAQLTGNLEIETRNIPASQVPSISRIGADNPSFRGSVEIPEGARAGVTFLPLGEGYVVQDLPFSVEVEDFRIEHYSTGQPKSFESDLVIHDPEHEQPLKATIAVNHPLIHDGYAIYQASFADGGSRLDLKLWPLNGGETRSLSGAVFQSYPLQGAEQDLSLELTDFDLFNVVPVADNIADSEAAIGVAAERAGDENVRNLGPSFTFKLRDPAGEAREYINYMLPVEQQGRMYMISGLRSSPAEEFRYLHIPVGPDGGVKDFMMWLSYLQDEALVERVAEQAARAATTGSGVEQNELPQRLGQAMIGLLELFMRGGFEAVTADVERKVPANQRQPVTEASVRVLDTLLRGVFMQMHEDRGDTPTRADLQWYDAAGNALSALAFYGSPWYVQLTNFEHVQATGLQITRSPGKNVVYLGCGMLIIGVFLMFYVAWRRLWVWIEPKDSGSPGINSEIIFAGSSNRNVLDFDKHFDRLSRALGRRL